MTIEGNMFRNENQEGIAEIGKGTALETLTSKTENVTIARKLATYNITAPKKWRTGRTGLRDRVVNDLREIQRRYVQIVEKTTTQYRIAEDHETIDQEQRMTISHTRL